jgi:RHS repeat-associated protein
MAVPAQRPRSPRSRPRRRRAQYAFSYNATGDRTSKTVGTGAPQAYTYAASTHRLTNAGTARSFDAAGNPTSINGRTHEYDNAGRLSRVNVGGSIGNVRSRYNALGQRVRKWVGQENGNASSDRGRYVYDEAGRLLVEEQIVNGVLTTSEIVWLEDRPILLLQSGGHTGTYIIGSDHLGTPRVLYAFEQKTEVWTWPPGADAFGETAPNADLDGDAVSITFNLRMPGQVFDVETGYHYNTFRDYEPGTGRYLESDPIGLDGGVSTYGYVGGNPINSVDRLGLAEWHVESLIFKSTLTTIPFTPIVIGRERRATISLHSQCFISTRGSLGIVFNPWTSNEMYSPTVSVVDQQYFEREIPYFLASGSGFTLDDGRPGEPNTANLVGQARIFFSVSGGYARGSITIGRASGSFSMDVRGMLDGTYEISGQSRIVPWHNQPELCRCPEND